MPETKYRIYFKARLTWKQTIENLEWMLYNMLIYHYPNNDYYKLTKKGEEYLETLNQLITLQGAVR
jgi:predicted transcriptional regulator